MRELWNRVTRTRELVSTIWKREPVRVLYALVIAGAVAALQILGDGVGWPEAIEAAWIALIGELARSQVTPVADPRLPD